MAIACKQADVSTLKVIKMNTSYSPFDTAQSNPYRVVAAYTIAATVTGAVPVPAASAAIVLENVAMITQLASVMQQPVEPSKVVLSMGTLATINMGGRTLFIEAARLLSWGSGQIWIQVALSAIGATTAGLQTFILGSLAIAVAKNGNRPLDMLAASNIIKQAKESYGEFLKFWRSTNTEK